jgi:hypothetical protein
MRLSVGLHAMAGIALSLGAGACSESLGPISDPSALRASLALVESVFASAIVQSMGILAYGPLPYGTSGPPLIPDSLLGKTFAWSCAVNGYAVSADTGAPATGVRIILYQRAPDGGLACPVTAIGDLDVFDVSSTGTAAVRAIATGTGRGSPLVEYTISHSVGDPRGMASAIGMVSDGQRRLTFQLTGGPGAVFNSGSSTLHLDDSIADVHEVSSDAGQMGVDTRSDDLDFTVQHQGTTVELKGSTGWFNTLQSWDEVVTVNNVPFVHVGGGLLPQGSQPALTPLPPVWLLTDAQRQLLYALVSHPGTIGHGVGSVLGAGARLVAFTL